MKMLALIVLGFGVAVLSALAGRGNASVQSEQIPISGLPSVTVNTSVMLNNPDQAQPISLGSLIKYNPGNPICDFYDFGSGVVVSTGPCNIVYSLVVINKGAYTISSNVYTDNFGEMVAVAGGTDPYIPAPDYTAITLTPNSVSSGDNFD